MIRADGLEFSYGNTPILRGVSLDAADGRVLGLIGPNGSGKTTAIRLLSAMLRPAAGRVTLDGVDIAALSPREIARRLAVVVQEPVGDLPMSVADMVMLGRVPHASSFSRNSARDYELAAWALDLVGARHLTDRIFSGLSGGEKQRVLIARALTQEPDHLLLDEPTNHLDIKYQHELLRLVRQIGVTTIVVLHDLNLAARYCDELVLLDRGQVAASGPVAEVLAPDLLRAVYGIDARRIPDDDGFQLLFRPLPAHSSPAATFGVLR